MEKHKLLFLKNILNQLEINEIEQISERTILINFKKDVRIFIDSTSSGIEFSLSATSNKGDKIIDKIEKDIKE